MNLKEFLERIIGEYKSILDLGLVYAQLAMYSNINEVKWSCVLYPVN